jgi:deoxyribodipyrimidine photo-lyase
VWFKRDLRVEDHRPLHEAAQRGPVLCLYVYEPELHGSVEFTSAHLDFLRESLISLQHSLRDLGGTLVLRRGRAVLQGTSAELLHGNDGKTLAATYL